jgi:hypothetical protein
LAVQRKNAIIATVALVVIIAALVFAMHQDRHDPADDLPEFEITGSTDLEGNIFVSFVYTKNIIMFDGKGDIVWSKHEDLPDGVHAGYWDFKKHIIDGKVYYSYHDQNIDADHYGLPGYAPGERVILDSDFKEVKRITFEKSDIVDKGHFLDGHDFLLIDLDHYIMSGYIKDIVYNVPGYESSSVVYSYLQEVKDGEVVWDWRSVDYPELYSLTVTDAVATANDFGNLQTDAPDYVHFNAMRLNDDGDLVCSFRHLNTIMCLDRTKDTDQIKWKLSGNGDEFGLSDDQKTSSQHYVTVDGDVIRAFDNHNISERTRIVEYEVDMDTQELKGFKERVVPGKFSSACGAQQQIEGELFMIGWGCSENDAICFSVYDFDSGKELMSMELAQPQNFTYRCVYYE